MTVELNHTILYARDPEQTAAFYTEVLGLDHEWVFDHHHLVIRVNDSLHLDVAPIRTTPRPPVHLAFKVTEDDFDTIVDRLEARSIPYSSRSIDGSDETATDLNDNKIYRHNAGRGAYFRDNDENGLEILTARYDDAHRFERGTDR